jgi:hypothetical protein
MECTTLDRVEENGVMVMRPKKQFDTLDKAIAVAKIENAKPDHIHKVVAYKCNVCHKYHVGRNGKPLTEKERLKRQREITFEIELKEKKREHALSNLKVVGYIDLSKIKY